MAFSSTLGHFTSAPDLISRTWATATNYVAGDTVIHLDKLFKAVTTHTAAAAFLTDYNSGNWELINKPNVKNYILNESGVLGLTTGWSTYADTSAATPTDGTGGSPTITLTSSNSSSLRGAYNFLLTKTGVDSRGQGISYDFVVDRADSTNMPTAMSITFDYEIASGTYGYGTSSTDSDLTIYIYDVTNAAVIQPSGYKIDGGKIRATFQPNKTSASYRLILHIATTSASAWTMKLSNIAVNPTIKTVGPAMTDWTSYTPTVTASVNPTPGATLTNSGKWRRVGDSMEIWFNYSQGSSGTAGTGTYAFSIPSGYTIDNTKLTPAGTGGLGATGSALYALSGGGSQTVGVVKPISTTALMFSFGTDDLGSGSPANFSVAAVRLSFLAKVPIVGWSSNTLVSDSADTRVVAMYVGGAVATGTLTTGFNVTKYPTSGTYNDTHSKYSASTGKYTIPCPGWYAVSGGFRIDSQVTAGIAAAEIAIALNGSTVLASNLIRGQASVTAGFPATVSLPAYYFTAGQTVEIQAFAAGTSPSYSNTDNACFFSVAKVGDPSQIAASEVIAAYYTGSTSSALANTVQYIDCGTKVIDTHNAVLGAGNGLNATYTSTWRYVCPAPGIYDVSAGFVTSGVTTAQYYASIYVHKNGSLVSGSETWGPANPTTTSIRLTPKLSGILVNCVKGDILSIGISDNTSPHANGANISNSDFISIKRLGGVM